MISKFNKLKEDFESGINFDDGSVVFVKCNYSDNPRCPTNDILPCGNIVIKNSYGCSKLLISWTSYLIYGKFFKEVDR